MNIYVKQCFLQEYAVIDHELIKNIIFQFVRNARAFMFKSMYTNVQKLAMNYEIIEL